VTVSPSAMLMTFQASFSADKTPETNRAVRKQHIPKIILVELQNSFASSRPVGIDLTINVVPRN